MDKNFTTVEMGIGSLLVKSDVVNIIELLEVVSPTTLPIEFKVIFLEYANYVLCSNKIESLATIDYPVIIETICSLIPRLKEMGETNKNNQHEDVKDYNLESIIEHFSNLPIDVEGADIGYEISSAFGAFLNNGSDFPLLDEASKTDKLLSIQHSELNYNANTGNYKLIMVKSL